MDRPRRSDTAAGHAVSGLGLVLAAAFFAASLTPSLMPREAVMQGVLGGLVAAIGHELGGLLVWTWQFLGLPLPRPAKRRSTLIGSAALALLICGYGLFRADAWQNAVRRAVELPPVPEGPPATIAVTGLATFLLLWIVARGFALMRRRLTRWTNRIVPPRIGLALGFTLTLFLFWALIDGVLIRRALNAADASFEAADVLIEPEIPRPEDPQKTGSSSSLIKWGEMGRWGRSFVSRAPTASEIAAFSGPGAMDPVRVYVGRRSAETAQARADLALKELIRQEGFARKALVVVVPVGTGWMDPGGHDTLDFIMGGDVATVAVQYSYLTSVLSLWVAPEYGIDQARILFDTIYEYWLTLPEDRRPRLFVHGLSQGAFNSQQTLPILDILAAPIDGAVWAGSPFLSRFWQDVRNGRLRDSPAWRPRFGNGSLVRVANQQGGLEQFAAPWGPIRLVFLQYGSDAIVNFTWSSGLRRPDWMQEPRAPDVAPEFRWFPVVTMFQLALDMAISLKVPGYGHYYIARDYVDAWAAAVDPEGWAPARAATLKAIFDARPPPF
ncbi:MAG: alpha/beta-hydrolase family protein [Rhodobacteraceae bacterium]|nr:alpha/beta-hydrolase family protein [Paracoccaceae bacterium]